MLTDMTYPQVYGILKAYYDASQKLAEELKRFLVENLGEGALGNSSNAVLEEKLKTIILQRVAWNLVEDIDVNEELTDAEIDELVELSIVETQDESDPVDPDMLMTLKDMMRTFFKGFYTQLKTMVGNDSMSNDQYWDIIGTIISMAEKSNADPADPAYVKTIYEEIIRRTQTKVKFIEAMNKALGILDEDKITESILGPIIDMFGEMRMRNSSGDEPEWEVEAEIEQIRTQALAEIKPKLAEMFGNIRKYTQIWAQQKADQIFGT